MIPMAELRKAAGDVLSKIDGLTLTKLTRHRARQAEDGGVYYGGNYFSRCDVIDTTPEYLLTCSMPRATVRHGSDCVSVWVGDHDDLRNLVKKSSRGIVDWTFYSYVHLDDDGIVMVFPRNREAFASTLFEATGTHQVSSCDALRWGL